MKKIVIGRNNTCDVIIPDTSDLVSRKQAVLAFSFWGKMILYDTSNNGTYINGQRLENGKGLKVTRKDKVNFARVADLDWNEVKDPYRRNKIIIIICGIISMVIVCLIALWLLFPYENNTIPPKDMETSAERGETTTTVQPQIVEEKTNQQPIKRSKKKGHQKRENPITPNEVMNKEVNDKSPIVY